MLPVPLLSDNLYGEDYFCGGEEGHGYVDYDKDKESMRRFFEDALLTIEKKIPVGTLLDVGAATGYFMRVAETRGWKTRGVEVSRFAARRAREQGLDVSTCVLAEMKFNHGELDAVTMWDVIEHMSDPEKDIEIIRAAMRKDGILAIVTPDVTSAYARLRGIAWHLFVPPEHIHCFSRAGMVLFLERHGFRVVQFSVPGKWFSLRYIARVLANSTGSRFAGKVSRFLVTRRIGEISFPLNFFDNAMFIAQKK